MNLRTASLCLLTICIFALPAIAQTDLYDNGPINGTNDAWTINRGFAVSDTFTLNSASTVTGLAFGAWLEPGDVLQSAEVTITSSEFGGTAYFDQQINFTQSGCAGNKLGLDVCTETSSAFSGPSLNAGTYWLSLSNATSTFGDPLYWDENDGPSRASNNTIGTLPSESFTLLGNGSTTGSTPEPTSILLFGSGVIGVGALLRRKLF